MKKKVLLVPMVLIVAGAFAVWANEQSAAPPGCNKCVKAEQPAPAVQAQPGCANCPKSAVGGNPAAPGCANCPHKGAAATPAAGCDKCVKLQQPVQKRCCNQNQAL